MKAGKTEKCRLLMKAAYIHLFLEVKKRFYKWLRENGYICRNSTSPTQKAMEMGLFEIAVRTIERGDGLPPETKTTKVTGKGQQYFINKFLA